MSTERPLGIVELKAGGPDDPDCCRTATVLGAYFHAEQLRASRHQLWARLAVVAVIWLIVATIASLSANTIFAGLLILAVGSLVPLLHEWYAGKRLSDLTKQSGLQSR
jgi:hypothetical protein